MKTVIIAICFGLMALVSCEEHTPKPTNTCSVEDPINDLTWLQREIQLLEQNDAFDSFIQQGLFQGETVFLFQTCCDLCNFVIPVYNCGGDFLCNVYECLNFEDLQDIQTIWKPRNFKCRLID